jgi:hypothetical protein
MQIKGGAVWLLVEQIGNSLFPFSGIKVSFYATVFYCNISSNINFICLSAFKSRL